MSKDDAPLDSVKPSELLGSAELLESVVTAPITTPVAFFDLDLTLLEVNSASLWVKREFKRGRLSIWHLMRATYWLGVYHLGGTSLEAALLSGISTLKDQPVDEFNERVRIFYEEEVSHRVRWGAHDVLEWHRSRGHLCYLMTNASAQLSSHFIEPLSLDGALCNHFEEAKGLLTGRPAQILCFGEGKLVSARQLLKTSNISLDDCYFYTDSFSDLPLLEEIGHPYAVHPDRKLRQHAHDRQWSTLDWDK